MIPTADPSVVIEYQYEGYVRYRRTDGARWEVLGTCDRRGDCLVGAIIDTPNGPVMIESVEHLNQLTELLGRERIDSELDVPVTWEFEGCCPFRYNVLNYGE